MEVMKVPENRQDRDKSLAAIASVILIIVVAVYFQLFKDSEFLRMMATQKMEELEMRFFVDMFATMMLGYLVAELSRRLCLFWEELYHLDTRYKKSKKLALLTSLSFDKRPALLIAVVALICLIFISSGSYGFHFLILIPFYTSCHLLLHAFGIWKPRESDLHKLGDSAVNFGHAFAWQYYFGYLKIVLPGFSQRVIEFEEKERLSIIVHKLFILLPESCYMPPLLHEHEADVNTLEFVKNLSPVTIDRNGTKNRTYENPVYRICPEGSEPFYCCVESASILNSLDDMCEKEKLTGVTEQKKSEQLRNFCCSLKNILDDDGDGLGKFVQLVYYEDTDADGRKVRISDVLKHHVGLALRQRAI